MSTYQRNDTGNALIIEKMYAGKLRYDHPFQRWIGWNEQESTWQADNANQVTNAAILAAEYRAQLAATMPEATEEEADAKEAEFKYSSNSKNLKSILASLKVAASLPGIAFRESWDSNPFIFHTKNGILNLETGEFRKATPEDNVLKVSPVEYVAGEACPKWTEFLNQIFLSNIAMVEYFQRCVGYTMTGNVSEQVLFACHGTGANGKSTALGVLDYIFGDYATNLAASSLEKWGRVVIGEGVDLIGARFAKCEEIGDGDALDTGKIKSWTGENAMRVRPMRKEWITFQPSHKLWLTFNSFPRINDPTQAAYRRIKPIHFAAEFTEGDAKKNLLSDLKAEASGILNWMIEGCRMWKTEGLNEPEICKRNLAEFRLNEDWLFRFLLDETIESKDAKVPVRSMYFRYQHWCTKEGINKPLTLAQFGAALNNTGTKKGRTKAERFWIGRELVPINTATELHLVGAVN
jgi:putative DNA primase/helicase